ncbi:MAG: hypothetical protein JRH20_31310, partial [Deltaproteobacteria bacterium]|nr:hypothetical protein [Deltaproteobacteria bacterium]
MRLQSVLAGLLMSQLACEADVTTHDAAQRDAAPSDTARHEATLSDATQDANRPRNDGMPDGTIDSTQECDKTPQEVCQQQSKACGCLVVLRCGAWQAIDCGSCDEAATTTTLEERIDPALDLHYLLRTATAAEKSDKVPASPALVAGQGEDPSNHSVVRIFDHYGTIQAQFLAFPSTVRGGVAVNAGRLLKGGSEVGVVVNALTDNATQSIRLYDLQGGLRVTIPIEPSLPAPYRVAVGDYCRSCPGDEIVVTSRAATTAGQVLLLYDAHGLLLVRRTLSTTHPPQGTDTADVSTVHRAGAGGDRVLLSFAPSAITTLYSPLSDTSTSLDMSVLANAGSITISESSFSDQLWMASAKHASLSKLRVQNTLGDVTELDIGRRENTFWVQPLIDDTAFSSGDWVRKGRFVHLRTDQASPGYQVDIDFQSEDFEHWAGGTFVPYISSRQADYASGLPGVWEPTFTHRHHDHVSAAWRDALDAKGLHKYMQLSRLDKPMTYVEGTTTFNALTYAPGLPAIDHLYLWPLRAFLQQLAVRFRGTSGMPEQLIALEPNHEFEIHGVDGTIGDYNTAMIAAFRAELLARYNNHSTINAHFGTSFTTAASIDPPRATSRGSWDRYAADNRFFVAWVEFNRRVVNMR